MILLDFYFVAYKIKSRITAEFGFGFFFGKINDPPEYDVFVVPTRLVNQIVLDLNADYGSFVKSFSQQKNKLFAQYPEVDDMSRELLNYLKSAINMRGPQLFGAEITAAVKDGDEELVRYIVQELFKDWAPKVEADVAFKQLSYEDISAESYMQLWEEFEAENLSEVMKRADLIELPEVFPLVDPVMGKPLSEFDLGDTVFFLILSVKDKEKFEKLKQLYPKHFSQTRNVVPLSGTLVAKELVKGKKGEYYLIKVDLGEGLIGKGMVQKSIKIMADYTRFQEKVSSASIGQQEWEKKLDQMVSAEQQPKLVQTVPTKPEFFTKVGSGDLLMAFLITLLIIGILLIVSYFFLI